MINNHIAMNKILNVKSRGEEVVEVEVGGLRKAMGKAIVAVVEHQDKGQDKDKGQGRQKGVVVEASGQGLGSMIARWGTRRGFSS